MGAGEPERHAEAERFCQARGCPCNSGFHPGSLEVTASVSEGWSLTWPWGRSVRNGGGVAASQLEAAAQSTQEAAAGQVRAGGDRGSVAFRLGAGRVAESCPGVTPVLT